jgi:hypothetical protein
VFLALGGAFDLIYLGGAFDLIYLYGTSVIFCPEQIFFSTWNRTLIHEAVSSFRRAGVFSDAGGRWGGARARRVLATGERTSKPEFLFSLSPRPVSKLMAQLRWNVYVLQQPRRHTSPTADWVGGVLLAHVLHLGTGLVRALVPATLGWAGKVSAAGVKQGQKHKRVN